MEPDEETPDDTAAPACNDDAQPETRQYVVEDDDGVLEAGPETALMW